MFIKSWQVNEQVPELIKVSDFPDELTARKKQGNKILKLYCMLLS